MNLVQGLTDDQLALVGCAAAFFFCGSLMCLSYYLGRIVRRSGADREAAIRAIPLRRPADAEAAGRKRAA